MDDIFELILIDANDYDAFRNLPTRDLPDTHNEWLKLTAKNKLERSQLGFRCVEVKVNSHDFANYLRAKGEAGNLKTLADFSHVKFLGDH